MIAPTVIPESQWVKVSICVTSYMCRTNSAIKWTVNATIPRITVNRIQLRLVSRNWFLIPLLILSFLDSNLFNHSFKTLSWKRRSRAEPPSLYLTILACAHALNQGKGPVLRCLICRGATPFLWPGVSGATGAYRPCGTDVSILGHSICEQCLRDGYDHGGPTLHRHHSQSMSVFQV